MKKIIKILIISIIIINTSFVFASDEDRSYDIKEYVTSLDIMSNGDVKYKESIKYSFSGKYNGVYRIVDFKKNKKDKGLMPNSNIYNAESIRDLEINAEDELGIMQTCIQSKGEKPFEYNVISGGEGKYTFKIHNPVYSSSRKLNISYTLTNALVTHSDVSELYTGLFADNSNIEKAKLIINFPDEDADILNEIKVYYHTTGENVSSYQDEGKYVIEVDNVGKDRLFDIRLVVPNKYVDSIKKTNIEAMPKILEIEETLVKEKANINSKSQVMIAFVVTGLIYFIYSLVKYIHLFNKYERENKSKFNYLDTMEIPNKDRNPIEVALIDSCGNMGIRTDVIMACILDLINKKKIKLDVNKKISKKGKVEYDYTLKLIEENPSAKKYVNKIVKLLFKKSTEINLKNRLKQMEKSTSDYEQLNTIWEEAVKDYKEENEVILKPKAEEKGILVRNIILVITLIAVIITFLSPNNTLLLLMKDVWGLILVSIPNILLISLIASGSVVIQILMCHIHSKYENTTLFNVTTFLNVLIMSIVTFLVGSVMQNFVCGWLGVYLVLIFSSIGTMACINTARRQKDNIVEERAKWNALKSYIKNYSTIKTKEVAHIINWEEYLTYAISFNLASKVKKEIELQFEMQGEDYMPYYFYSCHIMMMRSVNNSYANYYTSSSSSGGFSSGGGGGIGGGGGAF